MSLFLTAITVNADESQTHVGWEIEQEVVDLLHVMLGAPTLHAIVPAETYRDREELSRSMILLDGNSS